MRSLVVSLFLLLLSGSDHAWASAFPVVFDGRGLSYFIEDKTLSLDDFRKIPDSALVHTETFRPSLGFNSKPHWYRTVLKNTGAAERALIFEVAYPRLEFLEFHALDAAGQEVARYTVGTEYAPKLRPINHMNFAFPLSVPAGASITLYMKTSTHSPMRFPVKIWDPEEFREAQQNTLMAQGLYFGGIGIMVFYNMFVFLSTRLRSYLFYSLFVVCVGVYVGSEGGVLLRYIFTESAFWNNKITLIAIAGANCAGLLFIDTFMTLERNDPRMHRLLRLIVAPLLCSFGLVFLLPYSVIGVGYTVISAFTSILLITVTVRGLIRRQREAFFYAAAWITLLLGIIVFALMSLGFIPSSFIAEKSVQISSLIEVTILSFALADRLNQLRIGLKDANAQLAYQIEHVEEQVLIKTRDIRSIMEHIPLGVFSITQDGTVHKDYSRSVEKLLHRESIAGQPALGVLLDHAQLSLDKKDQMQAALRHVIGDDLLNFELNRSVFVEQMITEWQGSRSIYSLSWNPVCADDGRVEKILVTVHDSTRLIALESEAAAQREELERIKKILDIPPARFQSFLRQAEQLLRECQEIAGQAAPVRAGSDSAGQGESLDRWPILRMNLHTMKGMARSFDFDELAELCHQLEESSLLPRRLEIQQQLKALDGKLAQIKTVAAQKLGRRLDGHEAVELPMQNIHGLIHDLTQGTARNLKVLERLAYRSLDELLAQSMKAAHRLSLDLGKLSPRIRVEAPRFGITQVGYDALSGVLNHLVRNSLDHGLEKAEERLQKGKDEKGLLEAVAFVKDGSCILEFHDDGAGLDLKALRRKGEARGLLPPDPTHEQLAALIFAPELSTRDSVSSISGRGLGLSAVRDALRRQGGDIEVKLGEVVEDFLAFRLALHLPQEMWILFYEDPLALSA